jgi:hypothetical protein
LKPWRIDSNQHLKGVSFYSNFFSGLKMGCHRLVAAFLGDLTKTERGLFPQPLLLFWFD